MTYKPGDIVQFKFTSEYFMLRRDIGYGWEVTDITDCASYKFTLSYSFIKPVNTCLSDL